MKGKVEQRQGEHGKGSGSVHPIGLCRAEVPYGEQGEGGKGAKEEGRLVKPVQAGFGARLGVPILHKV